MPTSVTRVATCSTRPRTAHCSARRSREFPPEVSDPILKPDYFHEPLKLSSTLPAVYGRIDWATLPHFPWLVDDNRFALLWTSQISNRRHVEDIEFAYRILRHKFGFPAANIYVLCYDGTIGSTDFSGADMATWVGDNTAYQMQVTDSATKANLQSTLDTISARMNGDSLLFVHTNNHGSPSGLCVDNSSVRDPDGVVDDARRDGSVRHAHRDDGAVLLGRVPAADARPQPGEQNLVRERGPGRQGERRRLAFRPVGADVVRGRQRAPRRTARASAHQPDTNADGRVSVREAFNYSDAYEYANSYDDPQYGDTPVGCGSSIYLTKAPTLADIIKEILTALPGHREGGHQAPDPRPATGVGLEAARVARRRRGAGPTPRQGRGPRSGVTTVEDWRVDSFRARRRNCVAGTARQTSATDPACIGHRDRPATAMYQRAGLLTYPKGVYNHTPTGYTEQRS